MPQLGHSCYNESVAPVESCILPQAPLLNDAAPPPTRRLQHQAGLPTFLNMVTPLLTKVTPSTTSSAPSFFRNCKTKWTFAVASMHVKRGNKSCKPTSNFFRHEKLLGSASISRGVRVGGGGKLPRLPPVATPLQPIPGWIVPRFPRYLRQPGNSFEFRRE